MTCKKLVVTSNTQLAQKQLDWPTVIEHVLKIDIGNGNASPKTVKAYRIAITQFLAWCKTNNINPLLATKDTIKLYRETLIEKYAVSSISLKLSAIRQFFASLQDRNELAKNPAMGVKAPKNNTKREDSIKFVSEEGLKAVIGKIETTTLKGKRDLAMIALMAIHGLRTCEIAVLKMADLEGNKIKVLGKGRKIRTVYLTEKTRAILSCWLDGRDTHSEFVFTNLSRNYSRDSLGITGIEKIINGYLSAANVKKSRISCHALRHSAATRALAKKASLESIRDMLGHSSVITTEIYAKLLDKEKNNPAKRTDDIL